MGESGLRIEKHHYNAALSVWCILDGDRVVLCRQTEQEAKQEMERLRGDL